MKLTHDIVLAEYVKSKESGKPTEELYTMLRHMVESLILRPSKTSKYRNEMLNELIKTKPFQNKIQLALENSISEFLKNYNPDISDCSRYALTICYRNITITSALIDNFAKGIEYINNENDNPQIAGVLKEMLTNDLKKLNDLVK